MLGEKIKILNYIKMYTLNYVVTEIRDISLAPEVITAYSIFLEL